jgi:hypothetical protein
VTLSRGRRREERSESTPFALRPEVADASLTRLGVRAPAEMTDVAAVVDRFAETFPRGSTAKLDAIAAGQVPPGSDPDLVAERWLARPDLGWSCWAASTLLVGLVDAGGMLRADVLASRRIDRAAQPVDVHAYVQINDGSQRWLTDPHFRVPPIPEYGGEVVRPAQWAEAFLDGATWYSKIGSPAFPAVLSYHSITGALDRGDVETFCRLSTTHSGLPSRPLVEVARSNGIVRASVDRDGAVRLRRWTADPGHVWEARVEVVDLDNWADAIAAGSFAGPTDGQTTAKR